MVLGRQTSALSIMQETLRAVKRLADRMHPRYKSLAPFPFINVFISYAWPDQNAEIFQELLLEVSKLLQEVGINAFFDLKDMVGDAYMCMTTGIASADYILVMGTQRYGTRACVANTGVCIEVDAIVARLIKDPTFSDRIFPIMLESDPTASGFSDRVKSSFPDKLMAHCKAALVLDWRFLDMRPDKIEDLLFMQALLSDVAPGVARGLIPSILMRDADPLLQTEYLKELVYFTSRIDQFERKKTS